LVKIAATVLDISTRILVLEQGGGLSREGVGRLDGRALFLQSGGVGWALDILLLL